MMMNYEEKSIDYIELDRYEVSSSTEPFVLSIDKNGVKFEFLIKLNENSDDLLVMGSGSYDPNKMSPPVFQRHAWLNDFSQTVIIYNDPTLYLGKITLGWGNGTVERHYLKEISEILVTLIGKLNYRYEDTFFYGSSAGGYMSLILAGFLKGTTAIANNPQTIVANFWPHPVKEMIEASYPSMTLEEALSRFPERMNVIDFYKEINYIPKINFLQNVAATRDVDKHLIPFISGLNKLSSEMFSENVRLDLYSDKEKGHSPVGKKETIEYINKVIDESKRSLQSIK